MATVDIEKVDVELLSDLKPGTENGVGVKKEGQHGSLGKTGGLENWRERCLQVFLKKRGHGGKE